MGRRRRLRSARRAARRHVRGFARRADDPRDRHPPRAGDRLHGRRLFAVDGRVEVSAVVPGPGVLNVAAGLATVYAPRVAACFASSGRSRLRTSVAVAACCTRSRTSRRCCAVSSDAPSTRRVPRTSPVSSTRCSSRSRARVSAAARARGGLGHHAPCRAPASWAQKPDVPGPKQPDLALIDEAAGAHPGAAPRDPRRRRRGRRAAPLVALAERLGAPVVMTTEGKGAIPAGHPLALTAARGPDVVRRRRRPADPGLSRSSVRGTARGAARRHRDPHRCRSRRARPEREALDRHRGRRGRGRGRVARSRRGRPASDGRRRGVAD